MIDIVGEKSFFPMLYTFTILGAISWVVTLILTPHLTVGYASYVTDIYLNKGSVGDMFNKGFKNFWRNVSGMLWMQLFTLLWSLLFIIPGIVKVFTYSMIPYILADSKNVSETDAIKISMKMTRDTKVTSSFFAYPSSGGGCLKFLQEVCLQHSLQAHIFQQAL